jgi:hypothetical protein
VPGLANLVNLAELSGTSIRTALVDRFIVASYGGVASKTLVRGLLDHPAGGVKFTLVPRHHTHRRQPYRYLPPGRRVIYVYGDPAHAIASFFRRDLTPASVVEPGDTHPGFAGFVRAHCRHLEGDHQRIPDRYSLEDFLRAPADDDPFGLEDHFQRWTTARVPYPILLVRYETLWEHLDEIHAFVGLSTREAATFPPRKKTYVERHPAYDEPMARLRVKYARLLSAMESLPPVSLLRPSRPRGLEKIWSSYEHARGLYRGSFV